MGYQAIKIIYLAAAGLGLVIIVLYLVLGRSKLSAAMIIKVGTTDVIVALADTLLLQQRGL
ncbi:MAG: hypothetical protein Q8L21_00455, partial [Candidatus Komeilibacteria bacterium]|nr:hypothetical protein [Candidatus Komeilibacteria bacterium]